MENRRILNWHRLSRIRKAQVICGAIGVLLTIAVNIPWYLDTDLTEATAGSLYRIWLVVAWPTYLSCTAIGIEPGPTLLFLIELAINTFLFVAVGTLVGAVKNTFRKDIHHP